jgi:polysaccharide export outer membrane protein
MMRAAGALTALLSLASLGGCTFVPGGAPTAYQIEHSAPNGEFGGVLVRPLDPQVVAYLAQQPGRSFNATFHDSRPSAGLRIGPGDTLQISIWEAGGTGLFGQQENAVGAHSAVFQPVIVAQNGYISVPFAGRIKAAGELPDQVARKIEGALKDRALGPQAMVLISAASSNVATVGGDVNQPGVRPLDLRGDRLLDAIASAGGTKYPTFEMDVQLTRRGSAVTVPLQKVVDVPAENVFVQPGDSIYAVHNPPTFSAFGAAQRIGQYPFGVPKLYLSEAISVAGGLADMQADTAGVFLFRNLPRDIAAPLFPTASIPAAATVVPVAFRLDLSEAGGYVVAQETQMRDKDFILVTNAKGTQLLKLFGIVRGVTAPIGDIRGNLRSN